MSLVRRDIEVGGKDKTPAVITPKTRDASPPLPRKTGRSGLFALVQVFLC